MTFRDHAGCFSSIAPNCKRHSIPPVPTYRVASGPLIESPAISRSPNEHIAFTLC